MNKFKLLAVLLLFSVAQVKSLGWGVMVLAACTTPFYIAGVDSADGNESKKKSFGTEMTNSPTSGNNGHSTPKRPKVSHNFPSDASTSGASTSGASTSGASTSGASTSGASNDNLENQVSGSSSNSSDSRTSSANNNQNNGFITPPRIIVVPAVPQNIQEERRIQQERQNNRNVINDRPQNRLRVARRLIFDDNFEEDEGYSSSVSIF